MSLTQSVCDLYSDWVNENVIQQLTLGYLTKLSELEQQEPKLCKQIIVVLRRNYNNSKLDSIQNPETICMLLLCCNAYSFNGYTVSNHSHSTVCSLWRVISKTRLDLDSKFDDKSMALFDNLIANRTIQSYENCHSTNTSSSAIRTTVTSPRELMKRQELISSGGSKKVCIKSRVTSLRPCPPVIFCSYSAMIMSIAGYSDGRLSNLDMVPRCNCKNLISWLTLVSVGVTFILTGCIPPDQRQGCLISTA